VAKITDPSSPAPRAAPTPRPTLGEPRNRLHQRVERERVGGRAHDRLDLPQPPFDVVLAEQPVEDEVGELPARVVRHLAERRVVHAHGEQVPFLVELEPDPGLREVDRVRPELDLHGQDRRSAMRAG
jgi:hypothetical protein